MLCELEAKWEYLLSNTELQDLIYCWSLEVSLYWNDSSSYSGALATFPAARRSFTVIGLHWRHSRWKLHFARRDARKICTPTLLVQIPVDCGYLHGKSTLERLGELRQKNKSSHSQRRHHLHHKPLSLTQHFWYFQACRKGYSKVMAYRNWHRPTSPTRLQVVRAS